MTLCKDCQDMIKLEAVDKLNKRAGFKISAIDGDKVVRIAAACNGLMLESGEVYSGTIVWNGSHGGILDNAYYNELVREGKLDNVIPWASAMRNYESNHIQLAEDVWFGCVRIGLEEMNKLRQKAREVLIQESWASEEYAREILDKRYPEFGPW